jgi:hypothetical protein
VLNRIAGTIIQATSQRRGPFCWDGFVLDPDALVDASGCLPLLCLLACNVAQRSGMPVPRLTLEADPDASFDVRLTRVDAGADGESYLQILRHVVISADADLQLLYRTCSTAPGFGFTYDVITKTAPVVAFFKSRVFDGSPF